MESTRQALLNLLPCLTCSQCNNLLADPHIMGLCGHVACSACVTSNDACSVCQTPTTQQEIRLDHQMKAVVNCALQLKQMIFDEELDQHPATFIETKTAGDSPQTPCVSKRQDVCNVPTEQLDEGQDVVEKLPEAGDVPAKTKADHNTSSLPAPQAKNLEKRNKLGETLLHAATVKGKIDRVKELLEAGANPNVHDHAGWTPLHEACSHGYLELARLLISHGADVRATSPDGVTPLHDAVMSSNPDVVMLLMMSGADASASTKDGRTPLSLAQNEVIRAALTTVQSVQVPVTDTRTPIPETRCSSVVLLGSGLDEKQEMDLEHCAEILGAELRTSFSQDVTHLVVSCNKEGNCQQRTLKVLNALLTGKWIVSTSWVDKCLREARHVPEAPHEAKGTRQHPNSGAPRKAREHFSSSASPSGLFSDLTICLQGQLDAPPKEDLAALLTLGGATIIPRLPPSLDSKVIVVSQRCGIDASQRGGRVVTVPPSWVLDCVSRFTLCDPEEYLRTTDV
ncbi:BRCA1-associated RING domain protein 1-like [Ornithodoros turicata]|uniref:BRCA1-associated RING domain protein 1-like n=1 Tax=Ornithodoros turicata TaxID=34597 RepID=UPI0031396239